jgi:hypothetical protein
MAEFLDMDNQAIRLQVMGVMHAWRLQAEVQIRHMHERLDALLAQQQQRFLELDTRSAGMNPTVHDTVESFYAALNGMQDDRSESQTAHDGTMAITRTSLWSGETRTMELPITAVQLAQWEAGMPIQHAMPHLSATEREFVVSGMASEEWEEMGRMEEAMDGEHEQAHADIADLHNRMNEMQQARGHEQHQGHEQGMGLS